MEKIEKQDRKILRELAKKISEIGHLPEMEEKRKAWYAINELRSIRPMVQVETSGVMDEVIPLKSLKCKGQIARGIERQFLNSIFYHNVIKDDSVIEPHIKYPVIVNVGNFGVSINQTQAKSDFGLGGRHTDPPIKDIERDFHKLKFREHTYYRKETEDYKDLYMELFSDILTVKPNSNFFWTTGMTITLIDLIGMEKLLFGMIDEPEQIHRLMTFLRDEQLNHLKWYEDNGLLLPNNRDDYIGSGNGMGYTNELPSKNYQEGKGATLNDMWGLSESQETVGVSPSMFEEFVFKYQKPIISKFGLACYGCCEPVDARFEIVKSLENLRKVSVSPWANEEKMASYLGKNYVYSRKPNPTLISVQNTFDVDEIRKDIRNTLDIAKDCHVEIIMKDVHTVANEPMRLGKWVQIFREEAQK